MEAPSTLDVITTGPEEQAFRPSLWAMERFPHAAERAPAEYGRVTVWVDETEHLSLVHVRVPQAVRLSLPRFEQAATEAYLAARDLLAAGHGAGHPIRGWNFIPHIGGRSDDGLERYMAFNAGRFAAYRAWFGAGDSPRVPTASAVGHRGEDLYVYVLASETPSRAVENPRQISSYRYSARFGPSPPSFARATIAAL